MVAAERGIKMKKLLLIILSILLILLLTACGKYPDQDLTGAKWDKNWEMLGTVLGVEEVGNGFTLSQNASILTGDDTYYATWTTGEPKKWVNEDGDEVDLYPAQLYLMLYGCSNADAAKDAFNDFKAREEEKYTVKDTVTETHSGQDYTILIYDCGSKTNPYSRGVSAFGIYENYVVNAELTCTEGYKGNEKEVLADFLNVCHLAEHTD